MMYADACLCSSSGIIGPLWPDRCPGYGHVNSRRTTDLRNHHKFHDVFPGGAGFLEPILTCNIKRAGVALIIDVRYGSVDCWLRAAGCGRMRLIVRISTRDTVNGVDKRLAPFVKPVLVDACKDLATRLGI